MNTVVKKPLDPEFARFHNERVCPTCDVRLGRYVTFTVPPASTLNRITSALPTHLVCAQEAALAAKIGREVNCLYTVRTGRNPWGYIIFRDPEGNPLLELDKPESATWWCMGREATYDEVVASIKALMPVLEKACDSEQLVEHRRAAHTLLQERFLEMKDFFPRESLIILP